MSRRATTSQTEALGTEPVGRLLLRICAQTTAGVGIYGFYALTNAWFVARGVNEAALAAVNLVAPLLIILGAVSSTVGAGGSALVSLALGSKRIPDAARAAGNSFAIFWIAAIAVTVLGLVFMDPLLDLLGAHGETRDYAREYATILLIGCIASTGFSSLVRAEGRIRFSTLMWVSAVLIQITLDPLFIFVFDMGVAGAAWGTVAGQAFSALLSFWFFFLQKDRAYPISVADLAIVPRVASRIIAVGAPTFLAGFGAMVLAILINNRIEASGVAVVSALAGFAVASRLQTFATMPMTGLAQGLAPVIAYNTGAGLLERVGQARKIAIGSAFGYGVAIAAVIAMLARPLAGVFVSEPTTVQMATEVIRIIALALVFSGVTPVISAYFQSTGNPRPSYLISVGTLALIKIPLVVLMGSLNLELLWWSIVVGEALSAAVALSLYWAKTRDR